MSREGWRLARIGDFLTESRIRGTNGAVADKISVRLYGKGVVAKRDDRPGSARTVYYRRRAGQFIYSKLDFLNGAFGIVPPALDGYESTLDLPCFDIADDVDPRWLLASISRPAFYRRFKGLASGSRKAVRVRPSEFLASRISVPPRAEQAAIAACLQRMEAARQATHTLVGDLSRAKHGKMRRLLTAGLPEEQHAMEPLPRPWRMGRVAPGVTHMPAGWRLVRLTDFARLESGKTPSRKEPAYWGGDIPWLSLADTAELKKPTIEQTCETITQAGIDNSSTRRLPADTVILSRTAVRGLCSRLGRVMATSQDFIGYVCGPEAEPRYLVQVFRHMQREWRRLEQGSSPTNKTLYYNVFKRLQVLLPPLAEQRAIAAVGEAFDARIAAESAALERLTALKDGLARELLSGRLRLPPDLIARLADGGG